MSELQAISKRKEESEGIKGKGEEGRKRSRGKEGHVKSYTPRGPAFESPCLGARYSATPVLRESSPISFSLYLIHQDVSWPLLAIKELGNVFGLVFKPDILSTLMQSVCWYVRRGEGIGANNESVAMDRS